MDNTKHISTPRKFLRQLSIIHLALICGLSLFSVITYFLGIHWTINMKPTDMKFIYLETAIAIGAVLMGNFLFKKIIASADAKSKLKEKLHVFQTATIVQFALTEMPALLSIVFALITNNAIFFIFTVLLIFYFFSLKPSKSKVEKALALNLEHQSILNSLDRDIP